MMIIGLIGNTYNVLRYRKFVTYEYVSYRSYVVMNEWINEWINERANDERPSGDGSYLLLRNHPPPTQSSFVITHYFIIMYLRIIVLLVYSFLSSTTTLWFRKFVFAAHK